MIHHSRARGVTTRIVPPRLLPFLARRLDHSTVSGERLPELRHGSSIGTARGCIRTFHEYE